MHLGYPESDFLITITVTITTLVQATTLPQDSCGSHQWDFCF